MSSRDGSPRAKRSISLSVMLGTLLVPLSAYAASTLVERSGAAGSETALAPPAAAETAVAAASSMAADLGKACGEEGLAMVAAEAVGSISAIQQAALDALRGICAEQGMPLPAPPNPQSAGTVVTQPASEPPASAIEQVVVATDDEDDDGRHQRDDEDEDDHDRHERDDEDEDDHGRHGEDHD